MDKGNSYLNFFLLYNSHFQANTYFGICIVQITIIEFTYNDYIILCALNWKINDVCV